MSETAAAPNPGGDPRLQQLLHYDGTLPELYRIYLVNLLLTIVTLGIWRFWAITRMRRYVWSRTSMGGNRFEYDGTGKQLFISFVVAGLVIAGMVLVAGLAAAALTRISKPLAIIPVIVVELAVLLLALAAPFAAQRYRLGHTLWCGIRGGMEGSALGYGLRTLGYALLAVITLYQAVPWMMLRLRERLINASFLGDMRFTSRGRPGQLYGVFLLTVIAIIVLGVAVAGAVFALDAQGLHAMFTPRPRGTPVDPETQRMIAHAFWYFVGGYLTFGIGAALISAAYSAAFLRHLLRHTTAGAIQFGSNVVGLDVFRLIAGNLVILLVTLGFGYPILIHRNLRFITGNVLATGAPNPATLHQTVREAPTFGEGMFQQLDGGGGFL